MSQFIEKAQQAESKGKYKNAAQLYFDAGNEFLKTNNNSVAKENYLKALENAEKAISSELIVDIVFTSLEIMDKKDQKILAEKVIKYLTELLVTAKAKNITEETITLLQKKITCLKLLGSDFSEEKRELGINYQKLALSNLTSKKEEERKIGQEALANSSQILIEIRAFEEKVIGEVAIIEKLLIEGFVKDSIEEANKLLLFTDENKLTDKTDQILDKLIEYGIQILNLKAPKKLANASIEYFGENETGKKFLDYFAKKTQELHNKSKIEKIASIYETYAEQLLSKKKYSLSNYYFGEALVLLIAIKNKDLAFKLGDKIVQTAKTLFNTKGQFETGIEFYSIIQSINTLDKKYVAEKYLVKAEEMYKQNQIILALEDYIISAKANLEANSINEFNKILSMIFTKAFSLLDKNDIKNGFQYVDSAKIIMEEAKEFHELGKYLTSLVVVLIKNNQIQKAEEISIDAIEIFLSNNLLEEAAKAHKLFGNELLNKNIFDKAAINMVEAAKLYKEAQKNKEIEAVYTPLVVAAKNQLSQNNDDIALNLIVFAAECAEAKDLLAESKILSDFAEHAINNHKPQISFNLLDRAIKNLGKAYPDNTKKLIEQASKFARKLIPMENNYQIGNLFTESIVNGYLELEDYSSASSILLEMSELFYKNKHPDLAKNLLLQVNKVLTKEKKLGEFSSKVSIAGKRLIDYNFINEGIELLRRAVGALLSEGSNEQVIELATFASESANKAFNNKEHLLSKHLFIAALEFSSLVDLEVQDRILIEATSLFLEIKDLYSVKEFYEFARNNLEGEKDYLAKLSRLIIIQGATLRDSKDMHEEASDFIREGLRLLNQIYMDAEAGEVALSQGNSFINLGNYIVGEELIETGAQIFIKINDIERSGDAFLSLTDVYILRELWEDAFRQVNLANKSYTSSRNIEKLKKSIIKTAEIGSKALIRNPMESKDFALNCFETAIILATNQKLIKEQIEVELIEANSFLQIKDYVSAISLFTQITNSLDQQEETEISPKIAEEFSQIALQLILLKVFNYGNQLIDLAGSIYLRLAKPLKASEIYMKACNSLLKMNNVVDGVKYVLSASDTLMVADQYESAAKILQEIADLLFEMKDYIQASIVTGQIVTVHQKTNDINEQKRVINRLAQKATELIKHGQVVEGEQLWEHTSNYSLSTNPEFILEINNKRIENFIAAGMYNSTNNAYKQLLSILDESNEHLLALGDRVNKIAANLFAKEDYELSKNFINTAVDYYRKAKNSEKAKNLCFSMSKNFIERNDEQSGIELIDRAAEIANELEGAHEAAKTYLYSGFSLIESGFLESGRLAVKKAAEIEKNAQNIVGCIEMGETAYTRAAELSNSDIAKAIEIYIIGVFLFETAGSYSRAGDICTIVSSLHMNANNAEEGLICSERAVDYYIKDNNVDAGVTTTREIIESARRLMEQNELTSAVLILERARALIEKVGQFDLLSLIINIYIIAANHNLPNRKSSIGIFFLNRAIELAKSSPNPEENRKVIELSMSLALETIKKKNSLAGAKVLEIISNHPFTLELMSQELSNAYLEALKLTIEVEWNMLGKISRDALNFFKKTNKFEEISLLISYLTKRGNADLLTDKTTLGFFFIESAIRLIKETNNPELLNFIGNECLAHLQIISPETDINISYRLLGYSYRLFSEVKRTENIIKIGEEFVRLGSRDLINNVHSFRGYDALLTARDISISTQNDNLIMKVVMAFLDFAKQLSSENPNTTLSALEDVVTGLERFEVPQSNRANISYENFSDYLKYIYSVGEKLTKNDNTFPLGNKIIDLCNRIVVLTNNQSELEKDIVDTQKNIQKTIRKTTRDSAYKLRQHGILLTYLQDSNSTVRLAEEIFAQADELFQKKRHQESLFYTDTAIQLNEKLGIDAELRNIGMFALNSGDRIIREGRILEAMIFYELAVEAFDKSRDEESSSRLINTILQTREWDADFNIGYKCYQIAADSAIRTNNKQKAFDIATKCFNRGLALIDQPRMPVEIAQQFIDLAGKTMEDIGAIREVANNYDKVLLKYIQLLNVKKNIEPIIGELLTKIAINRMASCDLDSLDTIYLRVQEMAEMKKAKFMKSIATTINLVKQAKIEEAWNNLTEQPFVSHGRIRRIINSTNDRILYELGQKGIFDRTIYSTTDRSLPLSDYIIQNLLYTNKIDGQAINKDVFISVTKLHKIRTYFQSEFNLWGRVELENIITEFGIQLTDIISIIRREFLTTIYMGVLNNTQKIFFSNDRLKAEISLIINKDRKKDSVFDPMQVAAKMQIQPDIIKEILREISCEEVVEKALQS